MDPRDHTRVVQFLTNRSVDSPDLPDGCLSSNNRQLISQARCRWRNDYFFSESNWNTMSIHWRYFSCFLRSTINCWNWK